MRTAAFAGAAKGGGPAERERIAGRWHDTRAFGRDVRDAADLRGAALVRLGVDCGGDTKGGKNRANPKSRVSDQEAPSFGSCYQTILAPTDERARR